MNTKDNLLGRSLALQVRGHHSYQASRGGTYDEVTITACRVTPGFPKWQKHRPSVRQRVLSPHTVTKHHWPLSSLNAYGFENPLITMKLLH